MRHLEDADRCQQQRRGQRTTEQLDLELARRRSAQHPRNDPHAFERGAVRLHRRFEAGTARDVGEALFAHRTLGLPLERRRTLRDARLLPAHTRAIDLGLTLPAVAVSAHRGHSFGFGGYFAAVFVVIQLAALALGTASCPSNLASDLAAPPPPASSQLITIEAPNARATYANARPQIAFGTAASLRQARGG
jgi:hypothetical protein